MTKRILIGALALTLLELAVIAVRAGNPGPGLALAVLGTLTGVYYARALRAHTDLRATRAALKGLRRTRFRLAAYAAALGALLVALAYASIRRG